MSGEEGSVGLPWCQGCSHGVIQVDWGRSPSQTHGSPRSWFWGWGQGERALSRLLSPNAGSGGVVAGRVWQQCRGAGGDDRATLPLSESARRSAGRCGQRCPLTVTFKGLLPPAHEPRHSQPPAGLLQQDAAQQPPLTPGLGSRRQRGGPLGLAWSGCPPPRRGSVPRASALLRCRIRRWGPAPAQPPAPRSAQAGCGALQMDPGPRGGPGDIPKPVAEHPGSSFPPAVTFLPTLHHALPGLGRAHLPPINLMTISQPELAP